MLAQVPIVEAYSFVARWKDLKQPDGRDRVVRQGMGRIGQTRPGSMPT
jgi:putative transposase